MVKVDIYSHNLTVLFNGLFPVEYCIIAIRIIMAVTANGNQKYTVQVILLFDGKQSINQLGMLEIVGANLPHADRSISDLDTHGMPGVKRSYSNVFYARINDLQARCGI